MTSIRHHTIATHRLRSFTLQGTSRQFIDRKAINNSSAIDQILRNARFHSVFDYWKLFLLLNFHNIPITNLVAQIIINFSQSIKS